LKRIISLILSLCLILTAVGCSSTDDEYIYFELPKTPSTLDPQTASEDSELLIIKNCYEGLFRKDSNGKTVLGAAESFKENGLVYTFKIREDAKWSNGEKLTAFDFEFALKRALLPETKAPFASRLFAIENAKAVHSGTLSSQQLGVMAVNEKTLKITLSEADPNFKESLATSVAMPCNEKFFCDAAGKYGLTASNMLSNGSYELTRWRKDPFGIRLYRNEEYSGDFISKNAAVFITCDTEDPLLEKLEKNHIDMAFVDSALKPEIEKIGLQSTSVENICWFLTLSNDFSLDMRKSFIMLIDKSIFSGSLPSGYTAANSIYPHIFESEQTATGLTPYNKEVAKQLYLKELEKLEGKKFPSDVVLYYYDDGFIKNTVTDIVGHWQSNLSAFVNIEAVSKSSLLTPELKSQTYKMALFPVRADSHEIYEYLNKFGVAYNNEPLDKIQENILRNANIVPILFQTTDLAYSKALSNVVMEAENGYIDFSFIVKKD